MLSLTSLEQFSSSKETEMSLEHDEGFRSTFAISINSKWKKIKKVNDLEFYSLSVSSFIIKHAFTT